MPLLSRRSFWNESGQVPAIYSQAQPGESALQRRGMALFETCANPDCRTGWLHLWRSRSAPVFEGGWTCSPACTEARIVSAVARELDDGSTAERETYRHRVPLGLLLLQAGWITHEQLRLALEAQKRAGKGRLGQFLIAQRAISEEQLTRALGLQWSCPVLSLEHHDPAAMAGMLPRLFVDAFGALPLRLVVGRLLYLGFEEAPDPVMALSLERMTGLRVESGIVQETTFRRAHAGMLDAQFAPVELVEAVSGSAAARALARSVEQARPGAARLVRVHDCLWLRMWERPGVGTMAGAGWVRDLICSIGF